MQFKQEFCSFLSSGDRSGRGSGFGSGVCPVVRVLPRVFFGNFLLLKLLRMFFLVLENNPNVLKKDLFSVGILAVLVPLNLLTNLVCSLSASPNGKFRLCVSPEKQNVMQIY